MVSRSFDGEVMSGEGHNRSVSCQKHIRTLTLKKKKDPKFL